MKLSFHGADRDVTGSCHLVECAGKKVLIDCGLYQGGRELVEENTGPFGFDPADIDILLLTHAHPDHCGRIPLLAWHQLTGNPGKTFLVHDEEESMQSFAKKLTGAQVEMPGLHQVYRL